MNKLLGAEIFKSGTWNSQTFTDDDLDSMVKAFSDANRAGRVPLKFGHGDAESDQPFREGMPAMGWVERIYRQGKVLFADLKDIPTVVYNAIKSGAYKFVSIELLKNAEYDGKRFPFFLDAVALLGAEPPAVDGLADLQKLALSRASFKFSEVLCFTAANSPKHFKFTGVHDMTPEEIQAAIAKGIADGTAKNKAQSDADAAERAKFSKENEDLKAKLLKQEQDAEAAKVKFAREAVTAIIEGAVRAKKITPAKRELFSKTLGVDDDKRVVAIDLKDVEAMCDITADEAKKVMASGKSAFTRTDDTTDDDAGNAATEDTKFVGDFIKSCDAIAKEKGISNFAAMQFAVRRDPDLGLRFLNFTWNKDAA